MSEAEYEAKILEAAKAMHAEVYGAEAWNLETVTLRRIYGKIARAAAKVYGVVAPAPAETPGERFAKGIVAEADHGFIRFLRPSATGSQWTASSYRMAGAESISATADARTAIASAFDADRARLAEQADSLAFEFLSGPTQQIFRPVLRALIAPATPPAGGVQ